MTQQPHPLEPTAAPVGKGPAILIAAIAAPVAEKPTEPTGDTSR